MSLRGGIAQLGEHSVRNAGVEGSNPFASIKILLASDLSHFRTPFLCQRATLRAPRVSFYIVKRFTPGLLLA